MTRITALPSAPTSSPSLGLIYLYPAVLLLLCSALFGQAPTVPNTVPYENHGAYSVNLQSLSVIVNVPIREKSGANKFSASYTGVLNTPAQTGGGYLKLSTLPIRADALNVNALVGKNVSIGYSSTNDLGPCHNLIDEKVQLLGLYLQTADGMTHPFRSSLVLYAQPGCGTPTSFTNEVTTDGSGYTVSGTATGDGGYSLNVITANGETTPTINNVAPSLSVTDSNGNVIYANSGYTTYTDTLGVVALSSSGGATIPDYSYTDVNGGTQHITFSATSKVQKTVFGCGAPNLDYTYAAAPLITGVAFPDGTHEYISYETTPGNSPDVTGRVATITLRTGGVITFGYSGVNCMGNVTGSGGGLIQQGYIGPSVMTQEIDGKTWTYTWVPNVQVGVNGYTSLVGNTTTVLDPAGNKTVYTFMGSALVQVVRNQGASTVISSTVFCYNTNLINCTTTQVPVQITESDVFTTLNTMTTSSRVKKLFDAYGNTTSVSTYDFGASTPSFITTTTYGTWNGSAVVPIAGIYDKPGDVLTTDGTHNLSESRFTYDAKGNLTATSVWTGSTWLGSSSIFNPNGTVSTSTALDGVVSSFTYGSGSCNGAFPTLSTVGGISSSSAWDCNGGVVTSTTDANNQPTTFGYANASGVADPFWRISSVTDPLGNIAYTIYGPNSVEKKFSFGSSIQDTVSIVDGYGRAIRTQTKHGSSYDTVSTNYGFNGTGATVSSSIPCLAALNADCTTGFTTSTVDGAGRPYTTVDGAGGTVTHTFTKQDATIMLSPAPTGENVKTSTVEVDGLGRTLSSCAILTGSGTSCGQVVTGSGVSTTFTYSTATGSSTTTATRGSETKTTIKDALGRTTSRAIPEKTAAVTYAYSATTGLLSSVTDNGITTYNYYDSAGRLQSQQAGTSNCRIFVYDNLSYLNAGTPPTGYSLTNANGTGRMIEARTTNCVSGYITDEWFRYTARGALSDVYESTPHSGGYYHSTATYFANNALNTLSVPYYGTLTYGLDGDGRLSTAMNGTLALVSGVTYDAVGPTAVNIATGTDEDVYTHDPTTGKVSSYQFFVGALNTKGVLGWNPNGSLGSLTITDGFNANGSQTCTFSSDDLSRIVSDTCQRGTTTVWSQTFSYDQYNNLTKAGSSTWNPGYTTKNQYNNGATYDPRGGVTYDGLQTYTWDGFNQMATATGNTFTYDALGRMVEKYNGSSYSEVMYGPAGKLAVMNGLTAVLYAYMPTPGGGYVYASPTTGWLYQHRDWVGSVRVSSSIPVSGNGVTSFDRAFAPYGEKYLDFYSGNDRSTDFTGDTQEFTSWLSDTPNRELNNSQGRWESPDPAGSGWNAYAYGTDPNGSTDPSGLEMCCWGGFKGGQVAFGMFEIGTGTAGADAGSTVPANSEKKSPNQGADQSTPDQTQGKCGFWCSLGQRIKNAVTGHGFNTNEELLPKGTVTTTETIHEPNPHVTAATDVAGIVAPLTGKAGKVLGPATTIVSLGNDQSPTNVVLNVVPLVVEDTALPLAVVGAEADLLNWEAQSVMKGMIDAIPGKTMDDGYGHTVPNPAVMEDCQIFGACQ